jgi:hypothetical protein
MMYRTKLIFHLVFGLFSFRRKNMRFFTFRRLMVIILLCPLFLTLCLTHRLFLLLDYIIFPLFLYQKLKKPVFIVAAPRSGTTFLFHGLAGNTSTFSAVRLWEIVLAPSIIQKYLLLGLRKMDKWVGSPLISLMLFIEKTCTGKLQNVHLIGLRYPEEDEAFLIWDLSSLYLSFFYPDATFFDAYVSFDKKLPERERLRITKRYRRFLLRHNWVFNRDQTRIFVSKNPLMMNKLDTINRVFPDCLVLNINRNPSETLPSTVELNRLLYSMFTSIELPEALRKGIQDILIEWYAHAHVVLQEKMKNRHLTIDFKSLIAADSPESQRIAAFLGLPDSDFTLVNDLTQKRKHKSKNRYEKLHSEETALILERLPFLKPYCQPAEKDKE